jgi:hypothetical protein
VTTLSSGAHSLAARMAAPAADVPPLPEYVEHGLARMRLLHGVPFQYLLPDARLLPLESVRFFHLDPAWLAELVAGALAIGGGGARERAQAGAAGAALAFGPQLAVVRDVERGRITLEDMSAAGLPQVARDVGGAAAVTGFVLRSALVEGWPGLQIHAYASDDPQVIPPGVDPAELDSAHPELVVPILRLERLTPSVLLVLFGGVPRLVWLEEPHQGVQFGVDSASGGFEIPLRDEQGKQVGAQTLPVPLRSASLGIVDVAGLRSSLDQARPLPQARGSAALALALVQAPSRQRFTGREAGG